MDKWFAQQALAGNVYHSADTVAVTLTAINATLTGLLLYNPPTSSKLLVVKEFRFVASTDPGISLWGLEVFPAVSSTALSSTTANTIVNAKVQGTDVATGEGQCFAAATVPAAPVRLQPMGGQLSDAAASGPDGQSINLMGSLIIPAGMGVSLGFLTTAAVGLASVSWAEIDTNGTIG